MKDIIITGERRKKELKILTGCFAFAFVLNIVAIIIYKTPWFEMFSQIGYVVVIGVVVYLVVGLTRLLVEFVKKLFLRNNRFEQ